MTQPIACSLRPSEYADRTAGLRALADAALRSRAPMTGGERLVFAPDAGIERRLREAMAAEAGCCSFLRMDLHHEPGALVLDITGPSGAEPIIAELFANPASTATLAAPERSAGPGRS